MLIGLTLEYAKDVGQLIWYVAGTYAALKAASTYDRTANLERAKWVAQLYERFYEKASLKNIRDVLDDAHDSADIRALVATEKPEFTDYLNFFEYVAYLIEIEQLKDNDVKAIFQYYLDNLRSHTSVIGYISEPNHGYEYLSHYLKKRERA